MKRLTAERFWELRAVWIGAFARAYNHPLACRDEWEARLVAAAMFDAGAR